MTSHANVREARELYELKEQASKWYAKNGVPQKMEDVLNSMFYDQPTDVFGHLAEYFQGLSKPAVVSKVKACPALDSKGQMTLQTEVFCTVNNKQKLMSTNVCPSTSSHLLEIAKAEDKEEEDKEREEHLTAAIKHINNALGDKVKGLNPVNQRDLDDNICQFISELKKLEEDRLVKQASEQEVETEGAESELEKKPSSALSKPKSGGKGKGKGGSPVVVVPDEPREKIMAGSLCVTALSQALCCTGAAAAGTQLYEHIAQLRFGKVPDKLCLPLPMVTMLQSGRAAPGKCACIKEFMIVPKPGSLLQETLPKISAIYTDLCKSILNKNGVAAKNVTDTGALMLPIDRPEQGLDMIIEAMTHVGVTPAEDFFIALNLAGHEIFDYEKGKYEVITGQQKVPEDMADFWGELLGRYPAVIALIDPLRKQEDKAWMSLCERVSERCYVMGDHVWHRPGLLKDEQLTELFKTSGVVYRLEQLNTITDILEAACKMEEAQNETVLTTGMGDTTDTLLADMAVGMNARFIKIGAPCRGERVAKLNRLLSIETQLQDTNRLAHHGEFTFPIITPPPPQEPEAGEAEEEEVKKEPAKKK